MVLHLGQEVEKLHLVQGVLHLGVQVDVHLLQELGQQDQKHQWLEVALRQVVLGM